MMMPYQKRQKKLILLESWIVAIIWKRSEQLFCCNSKRVKDACIGMNSCTHSCVCHCNAHCVVAVDKKTVPSCAIQDDHSLSSGVYFLFLLR